ncbi:MSHA biogenesis protein MshO [Vibrio navarrensis]|uniref:PilW family protein n=1 Tax=Vibrio TaxID=662 RepID=UPI0005EFDA90|nr:MULTISPECIES: prepilin-type N-terminal cleavage/methylation domain-containing protein [Vibrio]KJR23811.1 MSHA biogenesis protein MshO [Vibrio sp. S234-5]MBE3656279.1 MSHA biogenesis protein MshO [Vibrio navarrensis]MBE3661420.1 MSHA biogenesis protein MshO [Vibrio navarrensis]MBE4604609.1 MSHA biogenesis protein MshO [Vibrio navarrensis]
MQRGFTLIEMVISIILLAVVGLFLGSVIRQGLSIYVDSSAREALIQQGRFVTERLSRELREAVPNSVLVANGCIEFLAITNSAIYSSLPSSLAPSTTIRLLPIEKSLAAGELLVVYPLDGETLRQAVSSAAQTAQVATDVDFTSPNDRTMVNVTLTQPTSFERQSPARRVYFYRTPVAFCYENNRIYRYADYGLDRTALQPSELGTGVLMVENLSQASFQVAEPELQRNGLIKIELTFEDRGEKVEFVHNALIYNTP